MELEVFNKKIIPSIDVGVLGSILLFFYFIDFLGKYGFIHDNFLAHLAVTIKPVFFVLMFIQLLKRYRQLDKRIIAASGILIITFVIGQLSLDIQDNYSNLLANIKTLVWYLLPIPIYLFLKNSTTKKQFHQLLNAFEWIFIINTIFLFIGLLFGIDIFMTYNETRFGYIGLFRNSTQGSYIYLIYTIYYYFKYKAESNSINRAMWFVAIAASILTGTKLLLLFCVGMLIYVLPYRKIAMTIITLGGLTLIALLNTSWFTQNITKRYFLNLYEVYHEQGLFSMLFSLRDKLFTEQFLPYISEKWTFLNYLFGGGSFHLYRSQLEYIDLFWFFGLVGMGLFLFIWYKILGKKIIVHPLFIILWILLGLAGNFFSSLTTCIHFIILIFFLQYYNMFQIENIEHKKWENDVSQ